MWSLGCVVGKLYLGDRLFSGKNEYEMESILLFGIYNYTLFFSKEASLNDPTLSISFGMWQHDVLFYLQMRSIVELLGQPPNQMLDAGQKTQHYFKRDFCTWNRSWKLRVSLLL